MRSVLNAVEVGHAVETGEGCAAALVPMPVELLLGEDVAAVLIEKMESASAYSRARRLWQRSEWSGEGVTHFTSTLR